MEAFHWIVIGVALFFLILILVFVGIMMRTNMSSNNIFPPVQQTCPNLWMNDGSGNCYYVGNNGGSGIKTDSTSGVIKYTGDSSFPIYVYNNVTGWTNSKNIGVVKPSYVPSVLPPPLTPTSNYAVFRTSDATWSDKGAVPLCQQKKFSNNNNIYWDGVSNTNQC
jgi:hypothetical protein